MYNGPQYNPLQQPKKHTLRNVLLGVGGLFVLLIIIGVAAGGGKANSSSATSGGGQDAGATGSGGTSSGGTGSASATTARGPGIGSKARDGKFQFVITRVSHAKRVGDSFLSQKAQGKYTVLHMVVTNIGSVAQTLDDSTQYVYDSRGRQFSADTQADIYGNGTSNSVFLSQINPGGSITGRIYFDMPTGDKAVKAVLHDSMFSGGVTVSLAKH
jgi:hypothetical protein